MAAKLSASAVQARDFIAWVRQEKPLYRGYSHGRTHPNQRPAQSGKRSAPTITTGAESDLADSNIVKFSSAHISDGYSANDG